MTDEQINNAIAEACGFKLLRSYTCKASRKVFQMWDYPKTWNGPKSYPWTPKFCNDLNAMHEAEKTIFPYYATVYVNKLAKITKAEYSDDIDFFCATARQRAEAFLRTLGKWLEATDKDSLTVGDATAEDSSVVRHGGKA